MSTSFNQFLNESAQAKDSLLCVGLDPRGGDAGALRDECFRLIEATAEFVAAFKPNSAFFEACGAAGLAALREVIARVPPGIPAILDAKRGDIAETTEAYARAVFDTLGAHALTVNPYLGGDALAPFLARPDRGVFVLCKTSNPGSDEFQALPIAAEGRPLFEVVAERAQSWNTHDNVGLVASATDPAALARIRTVAPQMWLLVPGVGAQGGDLRQVVAAGLRGDGLGLLVSVSRAIARAADPRAEAMRLREEINEWRAADSVPKAPRSTQYATGNTPYSISGLAHDLIATGCVRFGQFTLRSGAASPIYLDLRRLVSYPATLVRVARAYAETLRHLAFDRLAGIPYAGLPIATAVALEMGRPLLYLRREVKEYGTRAAVEGEFTPGETVAVIDDLATTGGTKVETVRRLEAAGLAVRDVVVLIDREQGAKEELAAAGYSLHAVVTLRQLLDEWQRAGAITASQFSEIKAYLA